MFSESVFPYNRVRVWTLELHTPVRNLTKRSPPHTHTQRASNTENVSIWWCYQDLTTWQGSTIVPQQWLAGHMPHWLDFINLFDKCYNSNRYCNRNPYFQELYSNTIIPIFGHPAEKVNTNHRKLLDTCQFMICLDLEPIINELCSCGVQLITVQHWFRQWLGTKQMTNYYLNQWWPASLMQIC